VVRGGGDHDREIVATGVARGRRDDGVSLRVGGEVRMRGEDARGDGVRTSSKSTYRSVSLSRK
jgi:hypothetical protein